jgi:hypothetical protein
MSIQRNSIQKSIFIIAVITTSGCSVFLPAHTNSNVREQERVVIRLLDRKEVETNYKAQYEQAFGKDVLSEQMGSNKLAPFAAAASIAVGFAVDYVKKQLEQEATLYEAQYSSTLVDDKFWTQKPEIKDVFIKKTTKTTRRKSNTELESDLKLDPPITEVTEETSSSQASFGSGNATQSQRYFGIELTRTAKCPLLAGVEESKKEADGSCYVPASKIVYGLRSSSDNQMFRIAPIYFESRYAKAKVPSDELFWWLAPWTWPGKFAKNSGHSIDIDVALEIDGYWRGKDQHLNVDKVAAIQTKIAGYDLDKRPTLTPNNGLGGGQAGGWLLGVPVSFKPDGTPATGSNNESGTFAVKILVTERDTSNSKKLLEQGAEIISKEGSRLMEEIQK